MAFLTAVAGELGKHTDRSKPTQATEETTTDD